MKMIKQSILMLLLFTLLTGILYPLAITGLAQVLFPKQANGNLLLKDGKVVGSELIGQNFNKPEYFHGRPSAAGKNGYDGSSSSGSNLGPTNKDLMGMVEERANRIREENGLPDGTPIPAELVTASGSGLDPDISPAAAYLQVPRVAKARNLSEAEVKALVEERIEGKVLGLFGEERVNVLKLNLALDQRSRTQ